MKCCRVDCDRAGTKRPVLSFTSKAWPNGPRALGAMQLAVCEEHALDTDPAHFVTDEGWLTIESALRSMGKAEPDRASLRIEFVSIQ